MIPAIRKPAWVALVLLAGCICEPGSGECHGQCVDLQSSDANCGTCGQACGPFEVCSEGACRCTFSCGGVCPDLQGDPRHCGGCGMACADGASCIAGACECPPGQEACSGRCVDLATDPRACGRCGVACPSSASCQAGACVCAEAERSVCRAQCVELDWDDSHCGECEHPCAGQTVCLGGACACPESWQLACDGACVDPANDDAHCGGCDRACALPLECLGGTCGCLGGRSACSGRCVDLQTDASSCGACGRVCAAGSSCARGRCVPELLWDDRVAGGAGYAGTPWDDDGRVVVDGAGNVTLAWSYTRSSVVVRRYDAAGVLVWTRTFITYAHRLSGLAVDASGRVALIAGFDSSWRCPGCTAVPSRGSRDVVVVAIDPDGTVAWQRFLGGTDYERSAGVAFTPDGDVVATGSFAGSFDPGGGEFLHAGSDRDLFVITLRGTDGALVSARDFGSFGTEEPSFLASAPGGDRVIAGHSGAGIDFGGGMLSRVGIEFIARLGPAFEHRWSRALPFTEIDGVASGSDGRVYVAGRVGADTTDFGSGVTLTIPRFRVGHAVVALDGTDGRSLWGSAVSSSYAGESGGVAVDASGVYSFSTYSQSSGASGLPSYGGLDVVVHAYDAAGRALWSRTYGSAENDRATGIALGGGVLGLALRTERVIDFGGGPLARIDISDVAIVALRP